MSPFVFSLVLLAALLHASWNALIKLNDDRLVAMALLAGSTALITLFLIPFVNVPPARAWPYIGVTSFIHLGYMFFLVRAYEHGDYGQVYPIARGTAPLITALIGLVVLGERLSVLQWFSILLITGGIMSLAIGKDPKAFNKHGVAYALATACFISAYTLVDATGARISGDVHGFAVWLFLLHGFPLFALTAYLRRGRLAVGIKAHWKVGLAGGAMSFIAYWMVLWAMTQTHVAPVAALRETSVIFAALIAALALKEPLGKARLGAAAVVALGVVLLTQNGV
ncbi:MAG: EamA family transporter [Alphaproteobacteria bacterium]|nr:MAG: EamA family transporter [Alphaproteobacteria bacterium]